MTQSDVQCTHAAAIGQKAPSGRATCPTCGAALVVDGNRIAWAGASEGPPGPAIAVADEVLRRELDGLEQGGGPEPLAKALSIGPSLTELLSRKPTFTTCKSCGCETLGALCFDCASTRDRNRDAFEETLASIPPRFRACRFGTDKLVECCHGNTRLVAQGEASAGASNVLLIGDSGHGKTSLAVAMMRQWSYLRHEPAIFALSTDLATSRGRAQFGREPDEVRAAREAPLLVLDELGPDEFKAPSGPVTDVVFYRHAQAKPTWITTWMVKPQQDPARVAAGEKWDVRAVLDKYGEGFVRRIIEGARILDCSAGLR
jgi:hypothetical protein